MNETNKITLLGPFLGDISPNSIKIWIYSSEHSELTFTIHKHEAKEIIVQKTVQLSSDALNTAIAEFTGLTPDTEYDYKIWTDTEITKPLDLKGLESRDLHFKTLPEDGFKDRLDFILLSCHYPEKSKNDGYDGFRMWHGIPQILKENPNIRFVIMGGDQVYADEITKQVLDASGENGIKKREREGLYLKIYKNFWDNIYYRKVLCSIPSFLMWDDHDIADGWGSRSDSFIDKTSGKFTSAWEDLFKTARKHFQFMQSSRNPAPLFGNLESSFDFCTKIGRAAFIFPDLRSNRNKNEGRVWLAEQFEEIKKWVLKNKNDIDILFFITPTVFAHGSPKIEGRFLKYPGKLIEWLKNTCIHKWLLKYNWWQKSIELLDLTDDINDGWGAELNKKDAEEVLNFFFELKNPNENHEKPISVVILSGDIHAAGYSTIYSSSMAHDNKRALIPHIVSSPIAYSPLQWWVEAYFREKSSRSIKIGTSGYFHSQISHHFCKRNVAVISIRNFSEEKKYLKVKFYLEKFPEPYTMTFDLSDSSHRENIQWE